MRILFILLFALVSTQAGQLQKAIDDAPRGATLKLPEGKYEGNIIIKKPLTIDGVNQKARIVGDGKGTVITIKSSNVVIKNVTVSGSGNNFKNIDSAIKAEDVHSVTIENNRIEQTLFGIDIQQVHRSRIRDNYITSFEGVDLGMRGDGIRMWYSHDNELTGNVLYKSRDFVVWYSSGNLIAENEGYRGRYSLHFMYAGKNMVRDNYYEHNSVGIFFMYSSGTTAVNNVVKNAVGSFGVGIGMKDSSNFTITDNDIIYNARGIYVDQSPYQPGTVNTYKRNKILYNSNGIQFQVSREQSLFEENIIKGNMEAIVSDSPRNNLDVNTWNRNYWDDYQGFDRNNDGIGDIPHRHYVYADKLWLYNENIKFFYGSVVVELLNFLAKIAPFSQPDILAVDEKPLMEIDFEKSK